MNTGKRTKVARDTITMAALSLSDPRSASTFQVVFNITNVETCHVEEHFEAEFAMLENRERLPIHFNIISLFGHFVGTASVETLGASWSVDTEFVRTHTLFVLMESMETSLKNVISERRGRLGEPPFFDECEFITIIQRCIYIGYRV